jgi:hypothetical protein
MRLAVLLIASNGLNSLFKVILHLPRPYWIDPRVQALSSETSYGIPSGHAMNATTIWGFLASQMKKRWAWPAVLALILMISISRLYLGVHFPTDVLAGWILGGLLLWAFLIFERPAAVWLKRLTIWQQIGLAFAISMVYWALFSGTLAAIASTPDPTIWEQNAAQATSAQPGEPATDPRNPDNGATTAGMLMGLGLSLALSTYRPTGFDAHAPLARRAARYAIGAVVIAGIWLGLKVLTPSQPLVLAMIVRYLRYVFVIFWALYLAPWTFVKLKV